MLLTQADLAALRAELASAFTHVTVESHIAAESIQAVDLEIRGAPDAITMLFADSVVIQAGDFTTEAFFDGHDFGPVRAQLVSMALEGYHAASCFSVSQQVRSAKRDHPLVESSSAAPLGPMR